jgi:hypothetical protein
MKHAACLRQPDVCEAAAVVMPVDLFPISGGTYAPPNERGTAPVRLDWRRDLGRKSLC